MKNKSRLFVVGILFFFLFSLFVPAQEETADYPILSSGSPKCSFPLYVCVPELLVAKGDIEAFMIKCRNAGAWGIRFFALQSWSSVPLLPFNQWINDGKPVYFIQPDTGIKWPVYDLNSPNPAYWKRFDEIISLMWKHGLKPLVSLDDYCSFKGGKETKFSYPFMMAKQSMSPAEDRPYVIPKEAQKKVLYTPGGPYAKNRVIFHAAYYRQVINHLKVHPYRIEAINEFGPLRYLAEGDAQTPKEFYRMIVNDIVSLGVPRAQIVHSGWLDACLANGGTYCLHNIVRPEAIPPKVRYMFSGDGGANGRSTIDIDIKGRRGLSVDDAKKVARIIKERKSGGYELYAKILWKINDNLANVDFFNPDVLSAITAESLK